MHELRVLVCVCACVRASVRERESLCVCVHCFLIHVFFLKACKVKNCEDIGQWIEPIRNHFWHCCQACDKDVGLLKVSRVCKFVVVLLLSA